MLGYMISSRVKSICLAVCLAVCLALLGAAPGHAVTLPDLYETSTSAAGGRDAALAEALRTVVVRVSGRRDAPLRLGTALNNPHQYLLRSGVTSAGILEAGFDSVSIDRLLTDAGLPIWGRERPATLVWLQIREPNGTSRWIGAEGASAERDLMMRAAGLRGLPIVWPTLDGQDLARAGALSGETAALLETAARYSANAALFGQAQRDTSGACTVRWTLASPDGTAAATGSLDDGVHLAADTFAGVYAASGASLGSVVVDVSGVSDLDSYAATLNYLEGMTVVRNVALEQVAGDVMRFRLAVRGDAETLRRAIALDSRLVPLALTGGEQTVGADRLQFRFQR